MPVCLQGAAFDLPEASAELLLAQAEELTKRKFVLERPTSLPLEAGRSVLMATHLTISNNTLHTLYFICNRMSSNTSCLVLTRDLQCQSRLH